MFKVTPLNFKYLCFLLPVLLFIIFQDFDRFSFNSSEYVIKTALIFFSYSIFFHIIYEFSLKKFSEDRHFFTHAVIYIPLSLFLLSGSYALYKGSSEVFGIEPSIERETLISEFKEKMNSYRDVCTTNTLNEQKSHCIEEYLTDSLIAQHTLLKERYDHLSNGYSLIAIITGFFGVLMTVLVIYFSISGKEFFNEKIEEAKKKILDAEEKNDEVDKKIVEVNNKIVEVNNKIDEVDKKAYQNHEKLDKELKNLKGDVKDDSQDDYKGQQGSGNIKCQFQVSNNNELVVKVSQSDILSNKEYILKDFVIGKESVPGFRDNIRVFIKDGQFVISELQDIQLSLIEGATTIKLELEAVDGSETLTGKNYVLDLVKK